MFIDLLAGVSASESLQGSNFYFKGGSYSLSVKALLGGETRYYTLEPGQGFRLKNPSRFQSLELKSRNAQTVEIEVSDDDVYDNRAVLSLSGAMPVTLIDGAEINISTSRAVNVAVAYAAGIATKILNFDLNRNKSALVFSTDVYFGVDSSVTAANGFLWTNGSMWIDENQGELWVFSVAAGSARIIQDKK